MILHGKSNLPTNLILCAKGPRILKTFTSAPKPELDKPLKLKLKTLRPDIRHPQDTSKRYISGITNNRPTHPCPLPPTHQSEQQTQKIEFF